MTATLFLRLLGLLTSLGFGYLVFDYNGVGAEVRHAVSGRVRFDDRPLDKGMIRFYPTVDTRTVGATAEIVDGEYAVPVEDGLLPGKYEVSVSGIGQGDAVRAFRAGAVLKDPVPDRFNYQSRIVVEVAEDGNILGFDFDLK